jgi:hypothetical protein
MKKQVLAALAVSLLAAPVFAQDAPPAGEHKGPHGGPNRFIEKVDTDKDGKVSRAEFQAKGDAMFKEADADGDGFITKEEAKASHDKRKAKWQARRAEFKKNQAEKAE